MQTTSSSVYYRVSVDGYSGYFSQDGYSKYNERLRLFSKGDIPRDQVYGYDQAVEHANEIKCSVYMGKLSYPTQMMRIAAIVTVETSQAIDIPIDQAAVFFNFYISKAANLEFIPSRFIEDKGLSPMDRLRFMDMAIEWREKNLK